MSKNSRLTVLTHGAEAAATYAVMCLHNKPIMTLCGVIYTFREKVYCANSKLIVERCK